MLALRAALAEPGLRLAVLAFLAFVVTEEAIWLGILLYAHDVGGASAVGLVAVAQLVPAMAFAPVGATLLDRLQVRWRLVLAYGLIAGSVAVLGGLLMLDAPDWAVLLAAVVATVCVALGRPAHYGSLPSLAELPSHLVAANAVTGTAEALGVLLGPLVVAITVTVGETSLLFLGLASMLAVAALASTRVRVLGALARDEDQQAEPFVRAATEGVREIRRIPGAFLLLVLVGLGFVLQGSLDVLGVVFALEVLDAGDAGASGLAGANGLGLLLGAGAAVVLVGVVRLSPVFVAGAGLGGLAMASVGFADTLLVAALLVVLSGVARSFADVSGRTLLHRNSDDQVMARVFGVQEAVLNGGLALGAALAPAWVSVMGVQGAFVATGALLAVPAFASALRLRRLDDGGMEIRRRLSVLSATSIFRPLPAPDLERLAVNSRWMPASSGQVLIIQGDVGDRFYAVDSGEFLVEVDGEEVARLGSGQFFGEIALLRGVPRTATVTCAEPGEVVVLDREVFLSAMTRAVPSGRD